MTQRVTPHPTRTCAVCTEPLYIKSTSTYLGDPMRQILGPGGLNQQTTVHTTYCKRCGLLYTNWVDTL